MTITITFKCGHSEKAELTYAQAIRDWQRWAKNELCTACMAKQAKGGAK